MKTSRRNFIKLGATSVAAALLFPDCTVSARKKSVIVGLQLWSVHEEMKKNPTGSLKQLAEMGYVCLEHAGYSDRKFYGYPATEFKKILDDSGLKMISGHTVMKPGHWDESQNDFTDSWKMTIEDAAKLQQKYLISPAMDNTMRESYDSLKRYMEIFNKCGELCNKYGMKFGYHNHDFEFCEVLNNQKVFDIIMNHIDPELVVLQLDTGNLYSGGAVAEDIINQYPDRFENIHVKDVIQTDNGKYESCILGEGIVNMKDVINLAVEKGGATCCIIEQESYQGKTPMECMKANLEIMKEWGY